MTQEKKELLLKDLCARLPYGVKVWYKYSKVSFPLYATSIRIAEEKIALSKYFNKEGDWFPIIEAGEILIKPYLRSMSSMSDEERIEFSRLLDVRYCAEDWEGHISTSYCIEIDNVYTDDEGTIKYPSSFSMDAIDWLNTNHFDYRGLIRMGLALEASKKIYKF